jgi:vacuolar-type H+-ATPase subunit H
MNEMINAITDAEARATEIKNAAVLRAGDIIEQARAKAAEMEKNSATERAKFKQDSLNSAAERAQREYDSSIEKSKRDAKAYAESVSSSTDIIVGKIVGRISGGNK